MATEDRRSLGSYLALVLALLSLAPPLTKVRVAPPLTKVRSCQYTRSKLIWNIKLWKSPNRKSKKKNKVNENSLRDF